MTAKPEFEWRITAGNLLSIVAMLGTVGGVWWDFSGEFAQAKQNIAGLQDQVAPIPGLESRMSVVEANQTNGRARSDQFQSDTKAALGKLQDQNLAILQELAALNEAVRSPHTQP